MGGFSSNVRVEADAAVAQAQAGTRRRGRRCSGPSGCTPRQAVGRKVVEEAQAQRAIAGAALRAAQAQRQSLDHGSPDRPGGGRGSAAPTAVLSPLTGTIREARVAPQAQVLAGTPLYEVVGTGERWVRVAVPAFELAALSREASAEVEQAGAATAEKPTIAARQQPQRRRPPARRRAPSIATLSCRRMRRSSSGGWWRCGCKRRPRPRSRCCQRAR